MPRLQVPISNYSAPLFDREVDRCAYPYYDRNRTQRYSHMYYAPFLFLSLAQSIIRKRRIKYLRDFLSGM